MRTRITRNTETSRRAILSINNKLLTICVFFPSRNLKVTVFLIPNKFFIFFRCCWVRVLLSSKLIPEILGENHWRKHWINPLDTGRKLNVYQAFQIRPGVLWTFYGLNLLSVPRGNVRIEQVWNLDLFTLKFWPVPANTLQTLFFCRSDIEAVADRPCMFQDNQADRKKKMNSSWFLVAKIKFSLFSGMYLKHWNFIV